MSLPNPAFQEALVDKMGKVAQSWMSWFQNLTRFITDGGTVVTLSPGGSPWTYTSTWGAPVQLLLQTGAGATSVVWHRTLNGVTTNYSVFAAASSVNFNMVLSNGDSVTITYANLPSAIVVPL